MINTDLIIEDIYGAYTLDEREASKRTHLGASIIGDKCKRSIFYEYRWYNNEQPEGRILRLFNTGKREEERVIENLKAIGFEFKTALSGKQLEFRDISGHIGGSVDGIIKTVPAKYGHFTSPVILEIKTHSEKNFKKFTKEKVLSAFPKHYHQMQYYMGSLEVKHALYLAVNKNTDEMYLEFLEFDNLGFTELKRKAESIVDSQAVPARISESASWFECKMCNFYGICHKGKEAAKNCRTCQYSTPYMNGTFGCLLLDKFLSTEDQIVGCEAHKFRE